ncbi:MAG: PucR family transcriptional regulator [Candidatus Nanopelagicales bacterium]
MPAASRAATARRLERASGELATTVTAHLDERLEWFRELPADERSWVGLIAQAGIAGVIAWYRDPDAAQALDVFSSAPRELAGAITLEQTVEMVRCTVDLLEQALPQLASPEAAEGVRDAVLSYSREVAFAAAEVYARAAEARGAWDARLEALVMEGLLRGDADASVLTRAAALGWPSGAASTVLVGPPPDADRAGGLQVMRRAAEHHGIALLTALHGDALVVLATTSPTGTADPPPSGYDDRTVRLLSPHFGTGPVVIGPAAKDSADIPASCSTAVSAFAVARCWPEAPRPVLADELLPERALAGESHAREQLVGELTTVLADPDLRRTLEVHLEHGTTLEGTARVLYVHPNTVRYRLRRIESLTGRSAADPRDALAMRLGLMLARL